MNIAVIPARGGSKRIPRKNIKEFCGQPLIAYSIQTAEQCGCFDKIVVSTDDVEIAEVALHYGAEVPFFRPSELSDDFTGTGAVVEHTLEMLQAQGERYDFVCTVYATAPLLQPIYLRQGYEALLNSDAVFAFSATSMPFPIWRTFKITPENRCEMFWKDNFYKRSQDLEEAYQDAGQFYWHNLSEPSHDVMFGSQSIPIVLPRHLVQDIDTLEDWKRAELLYKVIHEDLNQSR